MGPQNGGCYRQVVASSDLTVLQIIINSLGIVITEKYNK